MLSMAQKATNNTVSAIPFSPPREITDLEVALSPYLNSKLENILIFQISNLGSCTDVKR